MIRILTAAALTASLGGAALAQTTVTETTETVMTYGAVEGDGLEMATQETTTVTTGDGVFASDTFSDTTTDTADYSRYFDDAGNPIYLPDVSFSLD